VLISSADREREKGSGLAKNQEKRWEQELQKDLGGV
jgi:hypothetical protein